MARYAKDYSGEKRTEKVTVQLTPSERATLAKSAERVGASLSQHARELCLRRLPEAQSAAADMRRGPDARALVAQLAAIGNNLNQLARFANTERTAPHFDELKETTELLKIALSNVIGA